MNQPTRTPRSRARPTKAPSLLSIATDTGTYKVLLPVLLSAGLGWVNHSIDRQTESSNRQNEHMQSIDSTLQSLKRSQEMDKQDLVNRVAAIEKYIPDKVAERNQQMNIVNQQISDLTKSVVDLKESVVLLTYKIEADHTGNRKK